jgi:kumamolisin
VSANADPSTGYEIVCGGQRAVVGGTSASAPFWAGLIAAMGPKPGFCTWKLYEKRADFIQIAHGNNGKWPALICNGLGVPTGTLRL